MAIGPDYDGPRCGAKTRQPGNPPCKLAPILGQKRCYRHGGQNSTTERRRAEVQTERKVQAAVGRLKITPVEDPLTELKKLAGEVVAWKNKLGELVAELSYLRYSTESAEQIRGEVALFERAMDRCTTVLATIAKLNIDERLAAISETQAKALQAALFAAFEEAGLGITHTDEKKRVAQAFGRHLRLVA